MRRCLIAIFALHFFLSVSAFAFGAVHGTQPVQMPAEAMSLIETSGAPSKALQDKAPGDAAVNHALVDELPDLPDSLPRPAGAQRPPIDSGPSIGYRQRAVLPPSLDGLLRPPQQAPSAA